MAQPQAQKTTGDAVLKVVDILDHPYGGRIARTRLESGTMPRVSELRGARLRATGPDGGERTLEVLGFALTGGKVSDERLRRTGRVDLHVREEGDGPRVDLTWRLSPA